MNEKPHDVDARREADVAVTTRMLAIAERLPVANVAEFISECQTAAIDARLSGQLDLSALFVQLGAELMRTFSDGTIFMATTSRKSEAIRHMQWLDNEDLIFLMEKK